MATLVPAQLAARPRYQHETSPSDPRSQSLLTARAYGDCQSGLRPREKRVHRISPASSPLGLELWGENSARELLAGALQAFGTRKNSNEQLVLSLAAAIPDTFSLERMRARCAGLPHR